MLQHLVHEDLEMVEVIGRELRPAVASAPVSDLARFLDVDARAAPTQGLGGGTRVRGTPRKRVADSVPIHPQAGRPSRRLPRAPTRLGANARDLGDEVRDLGRRRADPDAARLERLLLRPEPCRTSRR